MFERQDVWRLTQVNGDVAMAADLPHDGLVRARRAQRSLAAELGNVPGVAGFGVGMNRARSDYAVHVYVRDEPTARSVPPLRDGVEVCVEIIGGVSAAERSARPGPDLR